MTKPNITREQFSFWAEVEVRWGDMDAQGHVNNAVYFTYCETARIKLLRALGVLGRSGGAAQGPTLVTTSCDFKQQVRYPTTLDIGVRVERIGQRSFELSYAMFRQGTDELLAVARSVNAWVDFAQERAVPLPAELRAAFGQYQTGSPAESAHGES